MDPERLASRYFGIESTEDPRKLLGITHGRTDEIAIKKALRRRKAQLYVHPTCGSEDTKTVLMFLEDIAEELIKSGSSESSLENKGRARLTSLDRSIIAALISEGGWNKKSRSRLVAIATSYSITVGGLMRILESFAEVARHGGGPLSIEHRKNHPIARDWAALPKRNKKVHPIETYMSNVATKMIPNLSSPSPMMTLKLSVLFGLLTIITFILSFAVLTSNKEVDLVLENAVDSNPVTQVLPNAPSSSVAFFNTYPTFYREGVEQSMLHYADQGVDQPAIIGNIAISLNETLAKGGSVRPSLFSDWNTAVDVLAYGWPFIDSPTMQSAKSQLVQVLLQAEMQPQIALRLIDSLKIPTSKFGNTSSIVRAVWCSGELAALSCDQRLSAKLRSNLRELQYPGIATCNAEESQVEAMRLIAKDLLKRTEFDHRSLEMWEAWLSIVAQLQKVTFSSELQLFVIQSIVDSDIDLLRESNTRKLLGRLIRETPWSMYFAARDTICEIIASDKSELTDVVLLTSLFNQSGSTSWFSEDFLLRQGSSLHERKEVASLLKENWPIDTSELDTVWNLTIPIAFDLGIVKEWKQQFNYLMSQSSYDSKQFAKMRLLNAAAVSIWKGRADLAAKSIEMSANFELETLSRFSPTSVLRDNTFSALYHGVDTKHDAAILELFDTGATDLGVEDADLLAFVALANPRREIRLSATHAIIEEFSNGRNVAVKLVKNFDKAKSNEQIKTLVANLTDVLLPEEYAPNWAYLAKRALIQHAMTAGTQELWELDEVSNVVSTSLVSEYFLLNPDAIPLSEELTPIDAIEMVVDSWRNTFSLDYMPEERIRFNPQGVLQGYLQKQLEYFALLQTEESRWRSHKYPVANTQLILSRLYEKSSITEQLFAVEVEIAKHWLQLFDEVSAEYKKRIKQ